MSECIDCKEEFEKYQWNQKRCYACIAKTDRRFKNKPNKTCPSCKSDFQPRTIRQTYCSDSCGKDGWNHNYFLRNYGITKEDYDKMFEEHNHRCAICKQEGFKMNEGQKTTLCVDHCHNTGVVRGLLCNNCNRDLGLLQDNQDYLLTAIEYLRRAETIPKGST